MVVSTLFNPLQFADLGDCEDFCRCPRQLDRDVEFLAGLGVDVVFVPAEEEMDPDEVATVVAKLFQLAQPRRAFFGQKDAQQVAGIRRMVDDLNFPVRIRSMPLNVPGARERLRDTAGVELDHLELIP